MGLHFDDLALHSPHAEVLAEPPQHARIQPGIEMIGVIGFALAVHAEPAGLRHRGLDAELAVICVLAPLETPQPVVVELRRPGFDAWRPERVEIAVAEIRPVDELDAELERAVHGAHELGLVELEQQVEIFDVRYRGLADADGADRLGFDQLDADLFAKGLGQRGRCHPAGGAATNDHDPVERDLPFCIRHVFYRFRLLRKVALSLRAAFSSSSPSTPRRPAGMCSTDFSSA